MNRREMMFMLPPAGPTVEHRAFRNEDGTQWTYDWLRMFHITEQMNRSGEWRMDFIMSEPDWEFPQWEEERFCSLEVDFCVELVNGWLPMEWAHKIIDCGCDYRILQEVGPGGGWPAVLIIGHESCIRDFIHRHFDPDGNCYAVDFPIKDYQS